jgi:hypothetical protein
VENYTDILERHGIKFRKNVRNMCHDWAICRFFPEGRQAVREMSEIIKKN